MVRYRRTILQYTILLSKLVSKFLKIENENDMNYTIDTYVE